MAIRNPLQEQLLKAGLVKKSKAAEIAREQKARQRSGEADPAAVDGRRLQAERAERDRAIEAERRAQQRVAEQRAQVRQIVEAHRVQRDGEVVYRFVDGDAVRELRVDLATRSQLARGQLVIVRHDAGYALIPRAAADMVHARGGEAVVDHGRSAAADASGEDPDAAHYARFTVPDDLIW